MKYIKLKGTDISVSKIGLGCDALAESFLQNKTKNPEELINTCLEYGINFFDTASTYSLGKSELILGRLLKDKRNEVIIASKGGKKPSYSALAASYFPFLKGFFRSAFKNPKVNKIKKLSPRRSDFSPAFIELEFKKSLERLNTDYLDIYLLHSPAIQQIQSGKTFELLRQYKKEGRIRSFGISVYTYEDIYWIYQNEEVDIIQLPFNPLYGDTLDFNKIKDHPFGIVGRDVFSKGLLTDEKALHSLNSPVTNKIIEKVAKLQMSIKEFAFRYSLDNPNFESFVIGTSNPEHLIQNINMLK